MKWIIIDHTLINLNCVAAIYRKDKEFMIELSNGSGFNFPYSKELCDKIVRPILDNVNVIEVIDLDDMEVTK